MPGHLERQLKLRRTRSLAGPSDWCRRCWGSEPMPHPRYYCPRCGQVVCAVPRFDEMVVKPHKVGSREEGLRFGQKENCLGGPVDTEKDRAP